MLNRNNLSEELNLVLLCPSQQRDAALGAKMTGAAAHVPLPSVEGSYIDTGHASTGYVLAFHIAEYSTTALPTMTDDFP